jgi:hypothetical protein
LIEESMSAEENQKYFDAKLAELDVDLVHEAVAVLRKWIDPQAAVEIHEAYAEHGPHEWIHQDNGHFGWGMACRNALREAGLHDDRTRDGNWDDYYVGLVEIALDLRPMPGGE